MNLQTQGRLTSAEQFGEIVLRANPDGSVLRVRDVARVEMGAESEDTFCRINGKPAVGIGIYLSPGANAVDTAKAVAQTLAKVKDRIPDGVTLRPIYDSTIFVTATIETVLHTLVEAFVIVAAVVFLFLELARHAHSDDHGPGQRDRHLRRAAGHGLFGQHRIAAGHGSCDRHRGR